MVKKMSANCSPWSCVKQQISDTCSTSKYAVLTDLFELLIYGTVFLGNGVAEVMVVVKGGKKVAVPKRH